MTSLTEHKNKLVKKILDVEKEETLLKIEAILDEEIIGNISAGNPLNKKEYIKHINDISISVNEGAKTYTTEEVKHTILGKPK